MEDARRITEEQKTVLDRMRHVHGLLKGLDAVFSAVEDVSMIARFCFAALSRAYSFTHTLKWLPPQSYRYIE